jgi:hypothetical protein
VFYSIGSTGLYTKRSQPVDRWVCMCNICIWVWTSYWFLDIDMLVDVSTISEMKIYIHAENVYISESELNTNSRHWHVGWYHCFAKHRVSFHDGRTKERQRALHCSLSGNKAFVGEHPQVLLTFPVQTLFCRWTSTTFASVVMIILKSSSFYVVLGLFLL